VILGLLIVVVPLIAIAQIKPVDQSISVFSLPEQIRKLERGYDWTVREDASKDLEVLSISFLVAIGVYVFVRRKRPRQGYRMGQYPYQY
jgi:hypothetical protein